MDSSNANTISGPILFEPVNTFEKMFNGQMAQKKMFSGKHSWVIVIKKKPFVHQVKSAPVHKQTDSTEISYQGKLFVLFTDSLCIILLLS